MSKYLHEILGTIRQIIWYVNIKKDNILHLCPEILQNTNDA